MRSEAGPGLPDLQNIGELLSRNPRLARLSSRRKQITLFCGPKDRSGTIFLLCPGLQRLSAGLPFANRVVSVALWLRNQKEIPDEMHTIQRITRLERCELDKNTGFRWRFA
jgi:hypothetical protein